MTEEQTTQQLIGRGIIELSVGFFQDLLKIDDCNVQGELKANGVFDELHKRLLLPEHYHILGVFIRPWFGRVWDVLVESPDIPLPETEGTDYPIVTPSYMRVADGPSYLMKIEIRENRFGKVISEHSLERVLKP